MKTWFARGGRYILLVPPSTILHRWKPGKVIDNDNENPSEIKRTTALSKLMKAPCERQVKAPQSVAFDPKTSSQTMNSTSRCVR